MTAPEMMLFPYNKDPATGSRIPSMSTGGAAMKAVMKQVVAAKRVGNMMVPNHPMYRRFSVLVIQLANRSQVDASPLVTRPVSREAALKAEGAATMADLEPVLIDAGERTVKASVVDARRTKTMEQEIFMLFVFVLLRTLLRTNMLIL
jgi:hypothetical protein